MMEHAHAAVMRACRAGKLTPAPCEVCGGSPTHAHHDDYSRPLVVRWLCNSHHRKWHGEHGPGRHRWDRRIAGTAADTQRNSVMADMFKRDRTLVDEAVSLVLAVGSVERAAEIMRVPSVKLREWLGSAGDPP